jgi:hypothetical protein
MMYASAIWTIGVEDDSGVRRRGAWWDPISTSKIASSPPSRLPLCGLQLGFYRLMEQAKSQWLLF